MLITILILGLLTLVALVGYGLERLDPPARAQTDIWEEAKSHVFETRNVGFPLLFITKTDFAPIRPYFISEWNFAHPEPSLRTREAFVHIHAIDFGEVVMLHHDSANPAVFKPLAIFHFFTDVVPYYAYCWTHDIPAATIFRPDFVVQK